MKRLLLFLLVAALVAAFALTGDTTYSARKANYIALGDSLGVGVGSSDFLTKGYVPLITDFDVVADTLDISDIFADNLSISGATSDSLITDQLPTALAELERNSDKNPNNDVELVTVDIGGNDVFALASPGPPPGPCFFPAVPADCLIAAGATLADFSINFDFILDELRTAAGPDTTIIVMTYYNPLPSCVLAALAPLADIVLEGGGPLPAGLNDLIRTIAATHDAKVADTFGKLGSKDLVGGFDCLHANDDGYEIIADEFKDAFKDQ